MTARVRPWRMLVVALGWGLCFPVLDWGARGGSTLWFVTWRALIAGLALLFGVALHRRRRGDRAAKWSLSMWGLVGALAILNVTVAFAAMAASVTRGDDRGGVGARECSSFAGGLPAWWLFGERPRVIEIVGVALGFGGLMLVARGSTGSVGAEALDRCRHLSEGRRDRNCCAAGDRLRPHS